MRRHFVKTDTFWSDDKKYLFARCCFIFESVTIGDFEQVMLAKNLVDSLENLTFRLEKWNLINCKPDKFEPTLSSLIDSDIKKSCLPQGVEAFDGDIAAFFNITGQSVLVLKPWGETKLFCENISLDEYRAEIILSMEALKKQLDPE